MQRGALHEIYVTQHDGALAEELGQLSTPEIEAYFAGQQIKLAEDQQAEAGLDACRWIEEAGRRLGRGIVLTVDYGHEARELYNDRHMRGTVLAYADHRVSEDLLRAPGEQDLTAHVNFTALDLWGRRQGLQRTGSASQMAFLLALGRANEFADLYDPGATEVERTKSRLMLKTLIHPEGMGETFQVFIQHKGMDSPQLTGLSGI
jgi:SAM-dependent MidA family methyltransferase